MIENLKKYFSDKRFFLRIYETNDEILFWNDKDIKKNFLKKSINDELLDEIILLFRNLIDVKYKNIQSKKVSIIIPNYNNELFIVKCINSILANNYEDIEIIFIDDCSTDNSLELVKKNFSNNNKVRIYQNSKNMGAYYCRNRGIILSNGYYILNVDGDDFIDPLMISKCVIDLENKSEDYWGYSTHFQRLYISNNDIDKINHINKSNSYIYLFKRKIFNMIGYYQDNRFGADSEFIKRAKIFGYKFYKNDDDIFYNAYTISGKNLCQTISYQERTEYILKCKDIIKKNGYIKMSFLDDNYFINKNKICICMEKIKIGIIGLGFVGSAMLKSFTELECNIEATYDKYKNGGIGDRNDLLKCDILFSALPTVYREELQQYDKRPLEDTLEFLKKNKYSGIFVCKSTVEPGTCNEMANKYGIKIIHNPEFLTARTAFDDFHNQKHIVLGKTDLTSEKDIQILANFYKYFYNVNISYGSSNESESMKIFCNCFYSVKIQFFNELYFACEKNGSDYKKVVDMMLKNDWINPMHTTVPGPDGKLSYGGLCFPKDTNALNDYMKKNGLPNKVLNSTIEERNEMRDDRDNCY